LFVAPSDTVDTDLSDLFPKNKDKIIFENLRPISLLNVDYKILTKVQENRSQKVLRKIINSDQTGRVKGRYITRSDVLLGKKDNQQ